MPQVFICNDSTHLQQQRLNVIMLAQRPSSLWSAVAILCASLAFMGAFLHLRHDAFRTGWDQISLATHVTHNTDLILYSYFETPEAMKNFKFFVRHALHDKADFILMLNGDHTLDTGALSHLRNVHIYERENRCFDLGGFHEILSGDAALLERYKRFMFINASVRGPFFPPWANDVCWSDAYWDKLEAQPGGTKLVGMSYNCANDIPYAAHIQSMILAFDGETLQNSILPKMKCYEDMQSAIRDGETLIATWVREDGGDVFAMENRFVSHAGSSGKNSTAFLDWCIDDDHDRELGVTHGHDIHYSGWYEGTSLHPYETM